MRKVLCYGFVMLAFLNKASAQTTKLGNQTCKDIQFILNSFDKHEYEAVIDRANKTGMITYKSKVGVEGFERVKCFFSMETYGFKGSLIGSANTDNAALFDMLKKYVAGCLVGYKSRADGDVFIFFKENDHHSATLRITKKDNDNAVTIAINAQ